MAPKVIVLGLDGGSWNLLDPLVGKGLLPNISGMLERGTKGKMKSCIPTHTVPAWKCYSSGKNPPKLGVWDVLKLDKNKHQFSLTNSRSYDTLEVWDYLNKAGIRTGLVNMPSTFPPRKINGFMICGIHSPENAIYTYPASLKGVLKKKYNYRIYPAIEEKWESLGARDFKKIYDLIQMRFNVARDYLEQVGMLHLTIFFTDSLQHFYWDRPEVTEAWKVIDDNVGRLVDKCENIFLVSDHGFTKSKYCFYINEWLLRNGYLVLKEKNKISGIAKKLGVAREGLRKAASFLKLKRAIPPFFKTLARVYIPEKGEMMRISPASGMAQVIDWKNSSAVALGEAIYVLNRGDGYVEIQNKLLGKIAEIKNPDTDECIFERVLKKEELRPQSFYVHNVPDILAVPKDGYMMQSSVGGHNVLRKGRWVASHKREGIFLASGRDIRKREEIQCNITDVAPTILHCFGIPIPDDMDGAPLDIFKLRRKVLCQPGSHDKAVGKRGATDETQRKTRERLRGLGYLE